MGSIRCLYFAVAGLALMQGGCLLVAAGCAGGAAAGYCYCNGKVCHTYLSGFDDTWAATKTALADLGMPVVEEEKQGTCGFIKAKLNDGETVRIHVDLQYSKFPVDGPVTRVCIRVSCFGDHPASARILDQIGFHLAPAPPPGITATAPPNHPPAWTGATAPGPPVVPPPTTKEPPTLPKEILPNPNSLPK